MNDQWGPPRKMATATSVTFPERADCEIVGKPSEDVNWFGEKIPEPQ